MILLVISGLSAFALDFFKQDLPSLFAWSIFGFGGSFFCFGDSDTLGAHRTLFKSFRYKRYFWEISSLRQRVVVCGAHVWSPPVFVNVAPQPLITAAQFPSPSLKDIMDELDTLREQVSTLTKADSADKVFVFNTLALDVLHRAAIGLDFLFENPQVVEVYSKVDEILSGLLDFQRPVVIVSPFGLPRFPFTHEVNSPLDLHHTDGIFLTNVAAPAMYDRYPELTIDFSDWVLSVMDTCYAAVNSV